MGNEIALIVVVVRPGDVVMLTRRSDRIERSLGDLGQYVVKDLK